ncbi:MAG: DUF305 domain-containing protein [Defluviicoccus sp.]|nr:DUF305 domain-containing protein [Defluviicoccus sp.]MDG4591259.1 DUF305 domain-containing protein [Defluviicoccus sp.]
MLSAAPHNRLRYVIALAVAVVVGWAFTGDATAQSGGGGAMPMQPKQMSPAAGGPSHDHHGTSSTDPMISAYQAVNEKMHRDMMITFTGDADRDFVAGMIPHHQGAIDMAEVVLKYGKNPKIRTLAQEIIVAQNKEIALMKAWLAKYSR